MGKKEENEMNPKTHKRINAAVPLIFWTICIIGLALPAWSAESDYHGTYAGSFSGDDSGYWVAVVNSSSSDSVFLSYSTVYDYGDGGYLYFQEESSGVGTYYSQSVINESVIEAFITAATGGVIGNWINNYNSTSGELVGNAITSSPQEGTYSGSIAGDATGTWSMTVASNGYLTGAINVESATSYFEGGAHPDGYMVGIGTDAYGDDFSFFGRISGTSASGSWSSESGDEGTFTTGGGSSGGGGSGGGGGGCFISSLTGK